MQTAGLTTAAQEARDWLFECLLPFWAQHGIFPAGGFVEQIDHNGPRTVPLRLRVQARQIYVFAEAGRLGWNGPWREIMTRGLHFMRDFYLRPDGLVRALVDLSGVCIDNAASNYDQAFALFALASAHRATGDAALEDVAARLLARLIADRKHGLGGFHESTPPSTPLQANPHMHMFEAAQAWVDQSSHPRWRALAEEIAALATAHFINPATGSLHEFYDLDWRRAPGDAGRVVEPGHEFEWTWLFRRWISLGGRIDPEVPERLYAHARRHGVDHQRKVAINAITADGAILDAQARLWPQTERLKAALAMSDNAGAVEAWQGLFAYRDRENPALYVDICAADGTLVPGPAFASSLYHITCAISELIRA